MGKNNPQRVALEKNSYLKQGNDTLFASNFKHFYVFLHDRFEKIHFKIPTIEKIHSLGNSFLETKP